MKKMFVVMAFIQVGILLSAQKKDTIPDLSKGKYVITNLKEDSVSYRDKASQTLRGLRDGAVIVRLKTSQKSVDAYRKSGRNDIADKIEADRQKQNEKMYQAFQHSFLFCKVYFIYANETKFFLEGNRKLFLDASLKHDPSIVFNDTNFVFCEYGSVEPFSKFSDYAHPLPGTGGIGTYYKKPDSRVILDTLPSQTSTSPATTSGLYFSDKDLKQLNRPFPFVEGVYMENYEAPVRALNRELERAYGRLVVRRDFKEQLKEDKKKRKQQAKEEQKSKPKTKWIDY